MHRASLAVAAVSIGLLSTACTSDSEGPDNPADAQVGTSDDAAAPLPSDVVFRSQVAPIRNVSEALAGVFIPPFEVCKAPLAGEPQGKGKNGEVCTNVMISACTEEGRRYPDYADCAVVRRQRPYWPAAPAKVPPSTDPRLSDPAYLADMEWARSQIAASGCTCCHEQGVAPQGPSQWDIAAGPLWIDTLSDTGLGLFTGLADSSLLGAYAPEFNHGFDRQQVGIPSTDPQRMRRIMLGELMRRGLTEEYARGLPPFGGPIYENSVRPATPCGAGEGIAPDGKVLWKAGDARYVYVLEPGGRNPGVPPNLDLPATTIWRLDVLASQAALRSGVMYGTTPSGSFQTFPESSVAPALTQGKVYQLFVQQDMGLPTTNCTFTFGAPVPEPMAPGNADGGVDAGALDAGGTADDGGAAQCSIPGPDNDPRGIGAPCTVSGETKEQCPCAANQCSKSPFEAMGYCTMSGCDVDPGVCPSGWTCTDLSVFVGKPLSICTKPK